MRHRKPIQATALFTVLVFALTNNWMVPTANAQALRAESVQIRPLDLAVLPLATRD